MSRAYRKHHVPDQRFPANANRKAHPYLTQDQFRDPQFLRVRRRVWLVLLPYCTGEQRIETERLIAVYDSMLK